MNWEEIARRLGLFGGRVVSQRQAQTPGLDLDKLQQFYAEQRKKQAMQSLLGGQFRMPDGRTVWRG